MKKPRPEDELFRDMFLFVAVVKHKSFSRAASELRVSLSLLSRRIAGLEKELGVQLLKRTTRRLEPTEIGAHYFERCQHLVEEARGVHASLLELGAVPRGHLRVTMPVDFGVHTIAPLLTQFTARYPEITLDCDVSPQRIDLIANHFDVALRLGELPDSTLVVRPLTRLTSHVYAAPGYLARHGAPQHPSDLAGHACIRILGPRSSSTWSFQRGAEQVDVEVQGRLAANNMGMIIQLVADSAGIGVIADEIGRSSIQAGRLIRLLPDWSTAAFPVVVATAARILPAKTRVFIDFLREQFAPASS
jgi:DNA-binding transcriptional LysR family regulator